MRGAGSESVKESRARREREVREHNEHKGESQALTGLAPEPASVAVVWSAQEATLRGTTTMAENTNSSSGGGNTGLAFIVGAVVVVLAIVAYFVFARGGMGGDAKDVNVDVNLPSVEAPAVPKAG